MHRRRGGGGGVGGRGRGGGGGVGGRGRGGGGLGQHLPKAPQPRSISGLKFI